MHNKFLKTMLLATLPMVALHADNNATKIHPLKDDPVVQHFQKLQSDF